MGRRDPDWKHEEPERGGDVAECVGCLGFVHPGLPQHRDPAEAGTELGRRQRAGYHRQLEAADVEEKSMQFLYKDATDFHFMDGESFEQFQVGADAVGDAAHLPLLTAYSSTQSQSGTVVADLKGFGNKITQAKQKMPPVPSSKRLHGHGHSHGPCSRR